MKDYKDFGYGDLVALHGQLSKEYDYAGADRKVVLSGEIARVAQLMTERLPDSLNVDHQGNVVPAHADAISDVADVAASVRNPDEKAGSNQKDETGDAAKAESKNQVGQAK